MRVITLLTDFGTKDTYVGIMKGVILSICQGAHLVDLTHGIPPQDVNTAAWQIMNSYRYFPKETIHVAVVDPGVGTARRPILIYADNHFFVGPDNGMFGQICQSVPFFDAYLLDRTEFFLDKVSITFHGRDIFAPIAGYLARGIEPARLGTKIEDVVMLAASNPEIKGKTLWGQIATIDNFGNLITNVSREDFQRFVGGKPFTINVGNVYLNRVHETYAGARPGEIIALFGSIGYLEIATTMGDAARQLKVAPGTQVTLRVE